MDDDDLVINDLSSDDDNWIPEDDEELQPDYNKIERKNYFILNMDGEGDYENTYMRKSEKFGGCFVLPNVPDEHSVNREDI
ncbi:hypothetical protein JTB14_012669 [Gonioctena quinquepunctata]|nr:hypothetical protein JTB14_012669 [Gonioctena quinquepunctata]